MDNDKRLIIKEKGEQRQQADSPSAKHQASTSADCAQPKLVTEGYIRSPPLPPTLLVDRFICIYQAFCAGCSKTLFFAVFRGLRRPRLSPNRAPVVSVMRAARTGLIDIRGCWARANSNGGTCAPR